VNERSLILKTLRNLTQTFTMNKREHIQTLKREIAKLNRAIDQKVLRGQSYFLEAKRHAFLLKQLQGYERRERGVFSRLIPVLF
jgi:hypothetical protein